MELEVVVAAALVARALLVRACDEAATAPMRLDVLGLLLRGVLLILQRILLSGAGYSGRPTH